MEKSLDDIELPNVRKLFKPDYGYTLFEADLKGADAQVVAWEAGDEDLKAAFRAGLDVHVKNATDMFGERFTSLQVDSVPWKKLRQANKHAVHGTNYIGSAYAIAHHPSINWSEAFAEEFQRKWFSLHPGIKDWHERIEAALRKNRTVQNGLGYRRIFFDRIDDCLPEAVAWIPQSTVALVTYEGALQLEAQYPFVQVLLQVHDSIVFQVPTRYAGMGSEFRKALEYPIPYEDPLIIPWDLKSSADNWGDAKKII